MESLGTELSRPCLELVRQLEGTLPPALLLNAGMVPAVLFPSISAAQEISSQYSTDVIALPRWYGLVGAAVCLLPAYIGSSEFVKRILI